VCAQKLTPPARRKKIETCPKYQSGELDIDSLCSDLATKAYCTETGLAVPKENFEAALWRLVGHEDKAKSIEKPLPEWNPRLQATPSAARQRLDGSANAASSHV